MSKRKNSKKNTLPESTGVNAEPLKIFIAVVPFVVGIYYEWGSSLTCIFLLGYLGYCYKVHREMKLFHSVLLLAAAVLPFSFCISILWAVDSGMTMFGMIKFLPIPLFVLAVGQLEKDQRAELLNDVPLSGVLMIILSLGLGQIPILNSFFFVNHRLAGFFQYPNTFALYLLIGMIVLLSDGTWRIKKVVYICILLAGIVFSGSRTGFALLIFIVLCYCMISKNKKVRYGLLGSMILLVATTGVFVLATGDTTSVGRYFTASLSSSTFLGRVLYYKDALPVILKHPLGLGYLGYYYTQGSFQTGVYSIMNIHNELLQILLDVGWIPAGLFIWAIGKGIYQGNLKNRMIIIVIALHSMLDFHLQFLAIFFILLSAIDLDEKKIKKISKQKILLSGAVIVGCVSLYFGTASALYYFKMYSAAISIYPGNTNAWMELLVEADDVESMENVANQILELNPSNSLANNAKARVAYSKGDFGSMINYKLQVIEYSKYNLEEYLDYFNMLYIGYQLYMENGDIESAKKCIDCIKTIPDMIDEVLEKTDSLAYKINDKPELELPEEYLTILQSIK